MPDLRETLQAAIRATDALRPGQRSAALRALEALPDGDALCHFDLHPDQVLMSGGRLVVIDWMTAQHGDPAADIARTLTLLIFAVPVARARIEYAGIALLRRRFVRAYVRGHPGVDRAEVDRWLLPIAAARLNENAAGERERLLDFVDRAACTVGT